MSELEPSRREPPPGAAARRRAMTEPDGSVTDSESTGPGAAPAATQARWVAVPRCQGSLPRRPGPSDRDAAEAARPDRRRVGARIYFRAVESTSDSESSPRQSARRHACQLSDWKARGRDACGRDWGSWRRTVSCRMLSVQGSKRDVLGVWAWRVWHVSTDTFDGCFVNV